MSTWTHPHCQNKCAHTHTTHTCQTHKQNVCMHVCAHMQGRALPLFPLHNSAEYKKSQNKTVSKRDSLLMPAAQNENRYLWDVFKSVLSPDLYHFVISMVMLREGWLGRLLYYLPSGHRTESHIPHLSLPVSLLCCLFLPQKLAPLLCYSFTSLQPILPSLRRSCLLLFPPLCHGCLVSFTLLPFLCVESICSSLVSLSFSLSPFLSGCVFFYLTLLFFCGFMPFTWEPFYPSLRALSSAVST